VAEEREKTLVWHTQVYAPEEKKAEVINPCPECGGKLILDTATGDSTCQKCGKVFDPTEVVK